jgi:hypothetical protein
VFPPEKQELAIAEFSAPCALDTTFLSTKIPTVSDKMHSSESAMTAMTVDAERRKKLRKKPLSLVYVELPSSNGGMMRDLSEEGFAMRAMIPLRAGQQTSFAFSLDEFTRIEGEGLVDWIEENGRVAGVKFVEIAATAREKIDEWLLRSEEPLTGEQDATSPRPPAVSTIEELREQMRTAPPRPVPPRKEQPSSPEGDGTVAASELPSSEDLPGEDLPGEDKPSTQLQENAPSAPEEDIPFPSEPVEHLSIFRENSDPAFPPSVPQEHEKPAAETQPSSFFSRIEHKWRMPATSPPSEAEASPDDPAHPGRDPSVPDISSILMQPAGISSGHPKADARHEHLANLDERLAADRLPWTEALTLSSAISVMFILFLTVGIYVFHREVGQGLIWLGERMGARVEALPRDSVAEQPLHSEPPAAPVTSSNPPQAGLASSQHPIEEQPVVGSTPPSAPPVTGSPPSHSLPAIANSSPGNPAGSQEPGQSEYSQAVQLLRANSGVGTADAVQLLWISVEKGNPNAEIALADLYWQGRGVPKNCDQTRILLAAAARKGNPEARRRLEQFQQQGCE